MLEILPKMLLGISQNLLLLCSFSVLLCLHYAPKLVRFVTSECSIRAFYCKVTVLLESNDLASYVQCI